LKERLKQSSNTSTADRIRAVSERERTRRLSAVAGKRRQERATWTSTLRARFSHADAPPILQVSVTQYPFVLVGGQCQEGGRAKISDIRVIRLSQVGIGRTDLGSATIPSAYRPAWSRPRTRKNDPKETIAAHEHALRRCSKAPSLSIRTLKASVTT
jgi:hypothetical protein